MGGFKIWTRRPVAPAGFFSLGWVLFLQSSTWRCAPFGEGSRLNFLDGFRERGFHLLCLKGPRFLSCCFSPLGGSEVQAAVVPPAPRGYDRGFGAPEAVTPFCTSFSWSVNLIGAALPFSVLRSGFLH